MENTENKEIQEQEKSWRGVQIGPDVPVGALINFLNVLNQRLSNIEDIMIIPGTQKTLTQQYAEETAQAEAEMAKAQAEQKEQAAKGE